jgi:hypothetical protein
MLDSSQKRGKKSGLNALSGTNDAELPVGTFVLPAFVLKIELKIELHPPPSPSLHHLVGNPQPNKVFRNLGHPLQKRQTIMQGDSSMHLQSVRTEKKKDVR